MNTCAALLGFLIVPSLSGWAVVGGQGEYADIRARYGKLHTIAGRAQLDSNGGNDWPAP